MADLSDHRLRLLGEALGKVLVKAGILRDDMPFTGPDLLNAADAFVNGCGEAEQVHTDFDAWRKATYPVRNWDEPWAGHPNPWATPGEVIMMRQSWDAALASRPSQDPAETDVQAVTLTDEQILTKACSFFRPGEGDDIWHGFKIGAFWAREQLQAASVGRPSDSLAFGERLFCGQKITAYVPMVGWEKALYIRQITPTHHQVFRIQAASCDFLSADEIIASEWVEVDAPAVPQNSPNLTPENADELVNKALLRLEERRVRGGADLMKFRAAGRIKAVVREIAVMLSGPPRHICEAIPQDRYDDPQNAPTCHYEEGHKGRHQWETN